VPAEGGDDSVLRVGCAVGRQGDDIVQAIVEGIYTSAVKGTPLHSVSEGKLEAGRGLVGDRYHAGVGTFSENLRGRPDAEITLIESEEIQRFNDVEKSAKSPGEFRRNIVTRGVRLNDLIGCRFSVGAAVLEGIRLCEPCVHLAKLVSSSVVETMAHRAGLRARVLSGAIIRPGDEINQLGREATLDLRM